MNKEQAKGAWNEFAGKVKQQWGKLTDDDIMLFKGNTQEFYGKIQQAYGESKEEAQKKVHEFQRATKYYTDDDNKAA